MEGERKFIQETEIQKESAIDLSALNFDFCDDNDIENYYSHKLSEVEDKEKWIRENRERLSQNKPKIKKVVEGGLILNDRPETIWQFQYDKAKEGVEKSLFIKKELEGKVENIKKLVAEKLDEFLPNWISNKTTISFTINEGADFCIDKDVITVDLGRLVFEKDFFEKVIQGITHEVFHVWMSERSNWSDSEQDKVSDEELRARIVFRTIDEGLAVLISGQSLKDHHEKQGKKYDEFIKESFSAFNGFALAKTRTELENIKGEEFQNMGHFYVVGYELVRALLDELGIEKFRKLIEEARKSPTKIIELYKTVCVNRPELPRIR